MLCNKYYISLYYSTLHYVYIYMYMFQTGEPGWESQEHVPLAVVPYGVFLGFR